MNRHRYRSKEAETTNIDSRENVRKNAYSVETCRVESYGNRRIRLRKAIPDHAISKSHSGRQPDDVKGYCDNGEEKRVYRYIYYP